MQRVGSLIGLRPEHMAEYRRVHAAVWPDVLKQIEASNIINQQSFCASRKTCFSRISSMSAMICRPTWSGWQPTL
jgi:L-rhamnose mutarotase